MFFFLQPENIFFFSYSFFFFLIELKILETDWKQIEKKKKMDYSYYLKIESEIKVIGREIFDEISSLRAPLDLFAELCCACE